MAFDAYRSKRRLGATPEPEPAVRQSAHGNLFVVHRHAARRLHYDLRLELGGALKSWAVPKGPSLDPDEKRLAVHVEDHPLDYADFEGVIPKGEYGGGTVMLWDRGSWYPLEAGATDPQRAYQEGKLKFRLDGDKLHGAWMLVRMKPRPGEERRRQLAAVQGARRRRTHRRSGRRRAPAARQREERSLTRPDRRACRPGRGYTHRRIEKAGRRGYPGRSIGAAAAALRAPARDAVRAAATRRGLAAGDQVRRLPRDLPAGPRCGAPVHATGRRLERALSDTERGAWRAARRYGAARRRGGLRRHRRSHQLRQAGGCSAGQQRSRLSPRLLRL